MSIKDYFKEEIKEHDDYWKKLGEYIGYIEEECINCGRHRVEEYSNGAKICEKCNFNQDTKEYEHMMGKYI